MENVDRWGDHGRSDLPTHAAAVRLNESIYSETATETVIGQKRMDFESERKFLESVGGEHDEFTVDSMPEKFIETVVMEGMKIDRIERGRIISSFAVPPRLLNDDNSLHAGATAALVDVVGAIVIHTVRGAETSGVSIEINVSYLGGASLGEEIEIESKVLRVGKAVAVVSVDFTSKRTGKLIAQGRHTKYLLAHSKL